MVACRIGGFFTDQDDDMDSMDSAVQHRKNNFDFLRILAAFLVLISHQYALNGLPEPAIFRMSLGTFAVLIFFSVSGFLVSQSWRQDPDALRFLAKRFLRIWPGLAVVTLLAAFVLGPLVSTMDASSYFASPELKDFLRNLKVVTVRYFLPGVFETNIYPRAVNGSLWTIPLEVRCYFTLLVIGVLGLMTKRLMVLVGTVLSALYYFAVAPDPQNYQYHFGLYFFAGVCLDLYRREWEKRPVYLLASAGAIALVAYVFGAELAALLLMIPTVTVYIGTRSMRGLNSFGRFGDISYGIYIYAFPAQQTVLWAVGKSLPFFSGLLLAAVMTILCALLSWHLVEFPALRLKRYLPRWFALPRLFRQPGNR